MWAFQKGGACHFARRGFVYSLILRAESSSKLFGCQTFLSTFALSALSVVFSGRCPGTWLVLGLRVAFEKGTRCCVTRTSS